MSNYVNPTSSPEYQRDQLIKVLTSANHAYYNLDTPVMDDYTYDRLYRILLDLETKYPELTLPESPTQTVGGTQSDNA